MPTYQIKVNGENKSVDVSADTPLLWVLRDHLDLVGTKYGCGIGQCGACTVHIDGTAMRSCSMTLEQVDGKSIRPLKAYLNMVHTLFKKLGKKLMSRNVGIAKQVRL